MRRRAVGRGRGKPQRSQSQESSCRTNRCNSRPLRRGSPSGAKLCSARPFWDHPSGWLGAVEGAREPEARKGRSLDGGIKALKGEPHGRVQPETWL